MIELLQYPFMQRALIAGAFLAILLALLGVFVILRRMAFFSDGIAHASLAGVAIGIILSQNPLLVAILFSILFALIIYFIEKKFSLASDAVIGIIFTSGMALGVMLMSLQPGYQPELMSFLFGNILAINQHDLWIILSIGIVVIAFTVYYLRQLILLALDESTAYTSGVKTEFLKILSYVFLAVSVVLGIKVLGIILVSALLIIPVTTAKIFARSFKKLLWQSIVYSVCFVIIGIYASYALDLPTGPTIVLTGTAVFTLSLLYKQIRRS